MAIVWLEALGAADFELSQAFCVLGGVLFPFYSLTSFVSEKHP